VYLVQRYSVRLASESNATILARANFNQALVFHTFEQPPHDNRVRAQTFGDDFRIRAVGPLVGNYAEDLDGGCHAGVCGHKKTLSVMFRRVKGHFRECSSMGCL
jgi:hypothetical protein